MPTGIAEGTIITYHRPHNLDDALTALASQDVIIAAGCTDLLPATKAPALRGDILDITAIAGLQGIETNQNFIRLGAATKWSDIIAAPLPPAFDMLKSAAREVGSVQIQNAGTVGGNLCNASPAADGVPCLLALDALVEIASLRGTRTLPLADFITGPRQLAMDSDELLTAILVPTSATKGRSSFAKLGARKYLVISIAMVALRVDVTDGRIADIAIAVGACSAVAQRLTHLEQALMGSPVDDNLARKVTNDTLNGALSPITDIRADAEYRTRAAGELIRRELRALTQTSEAHL